MVRFRTPYRRVTSRRRRVTVRRRPVIYRRRRLTRRRLRYSRPAPFLNMLARNAAYVKLYYNQVISLDPKTSGDIGAGGSNSWVFQANNLYDPDLQELVINQCSLIIMQPCTRVTKFCTQRSVSLL